MGFANGLLLIFMGTLCFLSLHKKASLQYTIIGGIVSLWGILLVTVFPIFSYISSFLDEDINYIWIIIRIITYVVSGILILIAEVCFIYGYMKNYALSISTDEDKAKVEAAFAVTSMRSLEQELKEESVATGDLQRIKSFSYKMLFNKLLTFQPKIGIASIIFGVWDIISAIIIR
jgi:hypothetical protein